MCSSCCDFSSSLHVATRPGYTERRIPHNYEKTWPFCPRESFQRANYRQMYFLSIRLTQSHNHDAGVRSRAELGEAAVGRNENPSAGLRDVPEVGILRTLFGRSTYVKYFGVRVPADDPLSFAEYSRRRGFASISR